MPVYTILKLSLKSGSQAPSIASGIAARKNAQPRTWCFWKRCSWSLPRLLVLASWSRQALTLGEAERNLSSDERWWWSPCKVTVEGSCSSEDLLPLTVVLSLNTVLTVLLPLKFAHLFQTKYISCLGAAEEHMLSQLLSGELTLWLRTEAFIAGLVQRRWYPQQYPQGAVQRLSRKGVGESIAGSRLRTQLSRDFFSRQIHGRPVPLCFPTTWKRLKEAMVAFEHQTLFPQQPGISENCSKDPLGLCAICSSGWCSLRPGVIAESRSISWWRVYPVFESMVTKGWWCWFFRSRWYKHVINNARRRRTDLSLSSKPITSCAVVPWVNC